MAHRTTRKTLIDKHQSAILALNHLNEIIYSMVQVADGRSDPITEMAPLLVDGHDTLKQLWGALRDQL